MRGLLCGVLLSGVVALVGACSGGPDKFKEQRPKVVPAGGAVTYKSQPVDGATVTFAPEDTAKGVAAAAITGPDGKFVLKAFDPDEGAVPGKYKVSIVKIEVIPAPPAGHDAVSRPPTKKYHVPQKYEDPEKSGLKAEVVDGQKNDFPFDLND